MDPIAISLKAVAEDYIGNPNSLHQLGTAAKRLEIAATEQIRSLLNLEKYEIIYTGSRCESNNLALFGITRKHPNKKEIIAYKNLSSSIMEPLKVLEKEGYKVHYLDQEEQIQKSINNNTLMICTDHIENSLKKEENSFYILLDACDHLEELKKDLSKIDFLTIAFERQNLPGISTLIKKKTISIEAILHGGKSTTIYRSGTPCLPFIVAFSKKLRLWYNT